MINQNVQNNIFYLLNGCIDIEKECSENVLFLEHPKDPNKVAVIFEFGPRFYVDINEMENNILKKIISTDKFDEDFLENIEYSQLLNMQITQEIMDKYSNLNREERNKKIKEVMFERLYEITNGELAKFIAEEAKLIVVKKEEQQKRIMEHKQLYFNLIRNKVIKSNSILALLYGREYLKFAIDTLD